MSDRVELSDLVNEIKPCVLAWEPAYPGDWNPADVAAPHNLIIVSGRHYGHVWYRVVIIPPEFWQGETPCEVDTYIDQDYHGTLDDLQRQVDMFNAIARHPPTQYKDDGDGMRAYIVAGTRPIDRRPHKIHLWK